ncbi:MAG: tyrosine-type recombinase/integrase [Eubacteriales bacterium]|nr:tyrosine-type recombinase/integrase [Eubacteriales bacterium]
MKPPLHFWLYVFRHTFATRMAEAGMPEKALMEIMGHEDTAVTLKKTLRNEKPPKHCCFRGFKMAGPAEFESTIH